MLKEKYIKFQENRLLEAVFHPRELTRSGLKALRKNIVIHTISFIGFITALLLGYHHFPSLDSSTSSSIVAVFALVAIIFTSLKFFASSGEYLTETGLWWRISVDDSLQDEWELSMKHKAQSAAFEYSCWFLWGSIIVWAIICMVSYLAFKSRPPMPPMSVVLWGVFSLAYVMNLLPLIFIAWTLDPIETEGEDLSLVEDIDNNLHSKAVKPPPANPQSKWIKYSLSVAPYVVGIIMSVVLLSHEDNVIYDTGYKIGHWIGSLFAG